MGPTPNSQRQRETQLLTEWWSTLPRGWRNKTHVNVGAAVLDYGGKQLSPAMQRAFGVWNDWADMRIFTGAEVWVIEAKLINLGTAYGQLLDYLDEYPTSDDYQQFKPAPIAGMVLCASLRARTAALFARQGIRTVQFTPSWALDAVVRKSFGGQPIL